MTWLFATGFFTDPSVHTALLTGGIVAVVAANIGIFTVVRSQSFAGEALADIGTAGGSGAFLLGIPALWGFLGLGLGAAAAMELIGVQRARTCDLATGVVLGAGLGLSALLLYEDTTFRNTTGATVNVLFGSLFTLDPALVPTIVAFALTSLGLLAVLYRPLLLIAVHPDIARSRRVAVRRTGALYLTALTIAVALAAVTIGSILSTALLVGPAASALRLTRRVGRAALLAATFGLLSVWIGVLLAYDSYPWPPANHGWPVSFFIVTLIFLGYLSAAAVSRHRPAR